MQKCLIACFFKGGLAEDLNQHNGAYDWGNNTTRIDASLHNKNISDTL